jgi:hypothetical protein
MKLTRPSSKPNKLTGFALSKLPFEFMNSSDGNDTLRAGSVAGSLHLQRRGRDMCLLGWRTLFAAAKSNIKASAMRTAIAAPNI